MAGAGLAGNIDRGNVGYPVDCSTFDIACYPVLLKTGGLYALHFDSFYFGNFYFCCGGL